MILKILFLFLLFALIKAIVPRYRYDQLMRLGWKIFLPFSLVYLVLTASFLFYFDKVTQRKFLMNLTRIFKTIFLIEFISGLFMAIKGYLENQKQ